MTWDPTTQPVDVFTLGGFISPGTAVIRDGKTKNKIEDRHPLGAGGAFVIYNGSELSTFTAELTLTTSEDFQRWPEFRAIVDTPPTGVRPKALQIAHPILSDIGITAVLVEGRTQLTQQDDNSWTVEIYFKQYKRPKPMRSAPAGEKKKKNQEEDELDKEIRRLSSENQQKEMALAAAEGP